MEESKQTVSCRHREEWMRFRDEILLPLFDAAGKDSKESKILADILKIYQEGERKAWGFGEVQGQFNPERDLIFEEE